MNKNNQTTNLKREILTRIIKAFKSNDFWEAVRLIPLKMRPKGAEVPFRCCIHKERAILRDRIIASLGFAIEESDDEICLAKYAQNAEERSCISKHHLTILDSACKGCVPSRVYVTDLCQGCVARPCMASCKFGAIKMVNGKSVIDVEKCKNCKMCIAACPYKAIAQITVPCEAACPVGAIKKNEQGFAKIDFDKCIFCGKCIAACPFGAVHEKSQIVDILKELKLGQKLVAMIAPAVAGQFEGNLLQLRTALKRIGFHEVFEVAQGADITIQNEAQEFEERMAAQEPFMTTSCCAGYNELVKKHLNPMQPFVSHTRTPLHYIAAIVKERYPDCRTVFISPCVAKRAEGIEDTNVDFVMTCEELSAFFAAEDIEVQSCAEEPFPEKASKQGRGFAVSGGVANAVKFAAQHPEKIHLCCINGLNKDSIKRLRDFAKNGKSDGGNLVEVMCCEGGCIGGHAVLTNLRSAAKSIASYCENSPDLSVSSSREEVEGAE